ncbi:MAG: hypothetical protein AAFU61_10625, partial [Pseudomonadota bacterium]
MIISELLTPLNLLVGIIGIALLAFDLEKRNLGDSSQKRAESVDVEKFKVWLSTREEDVNLEQIKANLEKIGADLSEKSLKNSRCVQNYEDCFFLPIEWTNSNNSFYYRVLGLHDRFLLVSCVWLPLIFL